MADLDNFLGDFLLKECDNDEGVRYSCEIIKENGEKKITFGVWKDTNIIGIKEAVRNGAVAITPPKNILVFEPEPVDKDQEKQKKLIEKTEKWLKEKKFRHAAVFSGGQSTHFWVVLSRAAGNDERKRLIYWIANELKFDMNEVDMSSAVAAHLWCLPGVFRLSKGKNTALLYIKDGLKMDIPKLDEDVYAKMKKDFGIVDIDKILAGVEKGGRDRAAIELATWYRQEGKSEKETMGLVMEWNKNNKPPLSDKEVGEKVKSAYKRDRPYGYAYSREPMRNETAWINEIKAIAYDEDVKNKSALILNIVTAWLLETHYFLTLKDTDELYCYSNGVYLEFGEPYVKKFIQSKLWEADLETYAKNQFVSEVVGAIKRGSYIGREDLNPKYLIPLVNGVYDFRERKFIKHSPEHRVTFKLPVTYREGDRCDGFLKFLREVIDEKDIPLMQEIFGYCLLQDYRFQNIFMLWGTGANGKSVLTGVLGDMLGHENISCMSMQQLETENFSKACLYGKLANIQSDVSSRAMESSGVIKMLTGNDIIEADVKFKKPVKFINHAKLIFAANELPNINDDMPAFWRRIILITFPNYFPDTDSSKLLSAKLGKEMSGIFNWAIAGLERLIAQNRFSYDVPVENRKGEWRMRSNHVTCFVDQCLEPDTNGSLAKGFIYNEYRIWCGNKNITPWNKVEFGKKLIASCGFKVIDGSAKDADGVARRVWIGLRLKHVSELGEPEDDGN